MQLKIGFSYILLSLLLGAQAKPTFYVINKLLDALDDRPHYSRPPSYYEPVRPSGPLIQEGYDHGYDYYYGGGGGHSYGNGGGTVGHPYGQAPPARGYYPRPVQGPVKGYYGEPQYEYHHYAPSGPAYGHGYGRSDPARVGGYKQHGY
ncbi:5'-3' exoribonuclease 2 [Drosophila grimshawi]|uniref:GH16378 n=1 Tax=Drosophila grimshawi TaxID=7222 RepID=B4JU81_DROGR|nr:5'-3' exoribonuclease 2 [Drosophila grimshawi]EDV91051.1 GH16378 [Drosophila grimshawi]